MPALTPLPSVLVTRPHADAVRWVERLQQRGLKAEALPLMEIAGVSDTAAIKARWHELGQYAAVMFVSGNAVSHFWSASPRDGQPLPPTLRCLAPGPGTAQALLQAGVPAAQIDSPPLDATQFDSQALWTVIGARPWQGQRVLIVRGHSGAGPADAPGRDWLARQWEAVGAQVDFVAVYERRAPHFSPAQQQRIQAAQRDGSIWLFSSSEALAHLPPAPPGSWRTARALATHPRIASAARAAGWGVVVESRPALEDLVASIESFPS